MNPLAERALLLRSRWPLYLLMLLWVMILPVQAATLNVARPGSGTGLIESAPDGISCGADCTGSYGTGTAVTLTATPGVASSFVGWAAGACAGQNSVCALNMTATDQTVAAYFAGARVVAGYFHSLALKSDGTVWAWGLNWYGQLGDGSPNSSATPVPVSSLTGVIALAAGEQHSLALKSDGTVWAWGWNFYGQLGDGSTTNRKIPVQVSGLSGVIALAAGEQHSLALKSDGTVWAWGQNWNGQLGDGSTTNRSTPVQVSGLTGAIALAAGGAHSLALKSDGTVWAWGANDYGQPGDGSTTYSRSTPVQVSGLTGVIALAAGGTHSLALKSDGTVWAWGHNDYGQLGDGSTTNRSTPVQVNGLTGVIALAAGEQHSLALKSDGTVWAWGWNWYGQLGDGTWLDRSTPVQVSGVTGVIALAAGYNDSLALKSDGSVWIWGSYRSTPIDSGFNTMEFLLSVNITGTGSGTVTSSPAGISCGSDCSESYTSGTSVTLTASAASGSTFAGWSGACSGTSTCTVSMSAARSVTANFSPAVASRQINIATRGWAGTGDSVMIAGFVISGTQPKKVLITAKGPVLATAGVPSVLADPNLTLYNSAGQPIQFNENWQSASNASAVAALGRGMNSSYPTEAALLTTLNPGAYTAIVRGAGVSTGNALVEVFDEDSSSTSKLINIATRGWAGTGDSVMIAGFVISGTQPKKVLITAKGPVLATAGVPSVLADPNLTLYNSAGQPIEFNEDWQSASNASEVDALGRGMRTDFPTEAALLTTLTPGAYTAIVRGAGTTTGNALVEVFDQD